MRGSLNKAKNKAALRNLEKPQAKKARDGLALAEGQAPPDHGNQRGDANMEDIFLPNVPRDCLDKAKRSKLKVMRGSLDTNQSQAKLKVRVQEGNTNMDVVTIPNMLSLDKSKSTSTKGDSFERLKLKSVRSLKTSESKAKVSENGEKGNTNMDAMALPDMLRFLGKEEALLKQLQNKMTAELSRLQVEEHVFLHTLKILSQKHASSDKVQDEQEISSGDQDLINALNEALMENGESMPSSEDKGEGTSEERIS